MKTKTKQSCLGVSMRLASSEDVAAAVKQISSRIVRFTSSLPD